MTTFTDQELASIITRAVALREHGGPAAHGYDHLARGARALLMYRRELDRGKRKKRERGSSDGEPVSKPETGSYGGSLWAGIHPVAIAPPQSVTGPRPPDPGDPF